MHERSTTYRRACQSRQASRSAPAVAILPCAASARYLLGGVDELGNLLAHPPGTVPGRPAARGLGRPRTPRRVTAGDLIHLLPRPGTDRVAAGPHTAVAPRRLTE